MDGIRKQMAKELLQAAEEFLQKCPGCAGLAPADQLSFEFFDVDVPAASKPVECVCSPLREAAIRYRAYDTIAP